ncbi:MAG TPA: hypothetical protein VK991_01360 [Halomonas sp.]|nr:hypothetical protein [Halomonas sp.]
MRLAIMGSGAGKEISELYGEVMATRGAVPNLASLLRVACAVHLHIRGEPAVCSA